MTLGVWTAKEKKSRRRVGTGCPARDFRSVAASFIAVVLIGFGYGQDVILRRAGGKLGDCTPAPQHDDAIAEADQFRHFAGGDENADALRGEFANAGVDFALRTDIDASRRLVEQKQPRLAEDFLGERDLLLVSPGERADGELRPRRPHI